MPLRKLEAGKGFPLDLRPPTTDRRALHVASKWFGHEYVKRITEKKHRGVVSVEAMMSDINEYDRVYLPRVKDDSYLAIYESVRADFVPEEPIIPWTTGKVIQDAVPKAKSPGMPWVDRGYKTKREVFEDPQAVDEIYQYWYKVGAGYHMSVPDCMVYFRAQICDRDVNKIRATWGYPTTFIVEEGRFVYPYLDWIRHTKRDVPVAYGVEMATGGMGYVDEMYLNHRDSKAVLMDWKRFDKTIPPWLIRDAFQILWEAFDPSRVKSSDGRVWDVDPKKTHARWKKLVSYFINTPFVMTNGCRWKKDGGVPSGSGFTNIIDTIVNCLVTRYCIYNTAGVLPHGDIYMGDDSLVFVRSGVVNLDTIAELALETFGMVVNTEKSYVTSLRQNIFFLGYYNYYGHPIRDQDFLIASFIYPERHHEEVAPEFTATRCLGQLWSTMNGMAANRWLDILEDIVEFDNLAPDWFDRQKEKFPHSLRWLRLSGLDDTKITIPKRGGWLIHEVEPPLKPNHRRPIARNLKIRELYDHYFDNFVSEEKHLARFTHRHGEGD